TFMNPVAVALVGVTLAAALGKKLSEIVRLETMAGDAVPPDQAPVAASLRTGAVVRADLQIAGRRRKTPLTISASPLISNGALVGGVAVWHDMSKEVELDRAKTEFVSLASHQLRTPLTAINWYSESVVNGDYGKLGEDLREPLSAIHESSTRMSRLINSLLNVSRIEMGRLRITPKPSDITVIVKDVVGELAPLIEPKRLHVKLDFKKGLKRISLDENLTKILFQNVISNAVKYTPMGGHVAVTVEKSGEDVLATVKDDGIGIPRGQQSKIFKKLFRAENVLAVETDGTGLGLYVAKAVVEQSGGKIWFTSEEGKGTTFCFTLPVKGVPAKEGEQTLNPDT
ncbi:MAG: hypothetical protein RL272_793, partial [Candidatus Parcubacteria bacterium]